MPFMIRRTPAKGTGVSVEEISDRRAFELLEGANRDPLAALAALRGSPFAQLNTKDAMVTIYYKPEGFASVKEE